MLRKKVLLFGLFFLVLITAVYSIFRISTVGKTDDGALKLLIINTNLRSDTQSGYDILTKSIVAVVPDAKIELKHYETVTLEAINKISPDAVIFGGQGTPWKEYPQENLESIFRVIRGIEKPVLGICGGHQLIAMAYGAEVAPIKIIDPSKPGYEGCWREKGFIQLENLSKNDPLFEGLGESMVLFENHCDEVKALPNELKLLVSGEDCRVQAFKHKSKPVYGVQFHPEALSDVYFDGKSVLTNFLTKIVK